MHQHDATQSHWLTRPATIRKLWWGFGLVLALTVVAQWFIPLEGGFGLDGTFGFYAWYGFGTCALMIFIAKAIGVVLKRPDDYYANREEDEA